ncbi:MAG: hypothetical protein CSB06_02500 [Bacteroidia bacterium]|nr:MAG: hypothetical protein CSB06_02500 [Bacteroidia bacterium]
MDIIDLFRNRALIIIFLFSELALPRSVVRYCLHNERKYKKKINPLKISKIYNSKTCVFWINFASR